MDSYKLQQAAILNFVKSRSNYKTSCGAKAGKHNKPRPRVVHRGIARFLRIDRKLNHVVPWSLCTFPENFMKIGPAVFS